MNARSNTRRLSWPRYEHYKPSGITSLDDIPAHWQSKSLKYVTTMIRSGKTPRGGAESYVDSGIPLIRSQNVHLDGLRLDDVVFIDSEMDRDLRASRLHSGDVLLNITGASIGRCCVFPASIGSANVNQHVCAIRPKPTVMNSAFLAAFLSCEVTQWLIRAGENGTSREGLNFEQIGEFPVPVPPLDEQRAIGAFLGHEATRLGELIDKRRRMIVLLKEKRAALITHVVTRGVDPDVPLKDSGIEWLGRIPTHWVVAPVAARYEVQLGKMLDEKRIQGTTLAPYLRNVDVQWERVNTDDLPAMDFSERDRKKFALKLGDLLVCEGGEVGRTAIWTGELETCYFQKALHRLRPLRNNEEEPRFMRYVMCWAAERGLFSATGNANTIDHLTAEKLRRHRFGFPRRDEQRALADFLDVHCRSIDGIRVKLEQALSTLEEYRASLITAAVTGQIDVRTH